MFRDDYRAVIRVHEKLAVVVQTVEQRAEEHLEGLGVYGSGLKIWGWRLIFSKRVIV